MPEVVPKKKNVTLVEKKKKTEQEDPTPSGTKVIEKSEQKEKPPKAVRLPELMKADLDDEALIKKLTEIPLTLALSELWTISPRVRELFSKPIRYAKTPVARVNSLGVQDNTIMGSSRVSKFWYSLSLPQKPRYD